MNYLETELDIIRVLGITGDFLQRQIGAQAGSQDPTSIGQLVNEQEINTAFKTIQKYRENLETQRDQLKETIVKTRVIIKILKKRLI